ncbi:MAG: hypothetical protein RIC16_04260 [Rhodospirillales bacterium]
MLSAPEVRTLTSKLTRAYLPVEKRALAVLIADARRNNCASCELSVPEIAYRAAVSERMVQSATRKLSGATFGLIEIEYRRIARDMNETNIYRLAVACFGDRLPFSRTPEGTCRRAQPSRAQRGAKKRGVNYSPSNIDTPTPTGGNLRKRSRECRKRTATGLSRDRSGPPAQVLEVVRPRTAPIPNISPDDAGLIKRALAVIRPDRALPDDPTDIVRAVDRLRLEYIPGFDEGAWPMLAARHGTRAYLAVVETLLMASVRAGTDRVIQSLPAYLGGILWKPREQVNPAHTVSEIIRLYADRLEPRRAA